jgi:4-amino-4-deoxy-L-arabinose transferase-like glycosyltransferase
MAQHGPNGHAPGGTRSTLTIGSEQLVDAGARTASPDRDLLLAGAVVAVVTLLHAIAAAVLKLSVDEAHYALWGLHPDWSYFDHPPLVGWLQWFALRIGDSELVLRLWALAGFVALSVLVYRIARDLALDASVRPARSGAIAVALVAGMPVVHFLGIGLVPELPLSIWSLWLVFPLASLARRSSEIRDWLAVGVLLGLAGLSQYTAALLPLGIVVFLVWERRWRWLVEPGAWLAIAIAFAMIVPVLYWNAKHDWVSFAYQWSHVAGGESKLRNSALFVLGQVVTYSLIVTLAVWRPAFAARTPLARLLVSLGAPIVVAGVLSGGKPHWTFAGWLLLVPLVACRLAAPRWPRWMPFAVATSALTSALAIGALLTVVIFQPIERLPFTARALAPLIGWDAAARHASALRAVSFPSRSDATLMVQNWYHASRLAWYARPLPVQLNDARLSQFDIWWGKPRGPAILVQPLDADAAPPTPMLSIPMDCRLIDELGTPPSATPANRFRFYRCEPSVTSASASSPP